MKRFGKRTVQAGFLMAFAMVFIAGVSADSEWPNCYPSQQYDTFSVANQCPDLWYCSPPRRYENSYWAEHRQYCWFEDADGYLHESWEFCHNVLQGYTCAGYGC